MTKKGGTKNKSKEKLQNIVDLLRFSLSLNDDEIMKSTIESVIELLEEEVSK